jgi:hypothetical protein
MPKSKNNRKYRGKKYYRGPSKPKFAAVPVLDDVATTDDCGPMNYESIINQLMKKKEYSVHQVSQVQKMALNQAILDFNANPLIVPCSARLEYVAKGRPELVYHTRYQDVKKAVVKKLVEHDLYFSFTSIESKVDEKTGLKQIQVNMNISHKLGGNITVASKPSLVVSCSIKDTQLTIDKCVFAATTKAKKDVLAGSVLNVFVDMPECYSGELHEYTDEEWDVLTPKKVKELNAIFLKLPDRIYFLEYLKTTYNVSGLRRVRGFQFDAVKEDLENWEPIARAS